MWQESILTIGLEYLDSALAHLGSCLETLPTAIRSLPPRSVVSLCQRQEVQGEHVSMTLEK